jgi:TRAP-type C4-dicarboxylate transport system permease small subunit
VQAVTRFLGWVFGLTMVALSIMVTIETIVRKLFSVSLGGVDELSGYAVAIAGPLAFAIALTQRSHIRINILYLRLSQPTRRLLDFLSVFSLAALSVFLSFFALRTVLDTYQLKSLAQTPWATPLIYPQSLWVIAMAVFSLVSLYLLGKAALLAYRKDWNSMQRCLAPGSLEEELKAELQDMKER